MSTMTEKLTATTTTSFAAARKGRSPIVLLLDRKWKQSRYFRELDGATKGAMTSEAKRKRFRGRSGDELVIQTHGRVPAPLVAMMGCTSDLDPRECLAIAQSIFALAKREGSGRLAVVAPDSSSAFDLCCIAEGFDMASYRFDEFRSEATRSTKYRITFIVETANSKHREEVRDGLRRAALRAQAVAFARDLANTPAASLRPEDLAQRAATHAGGDLEVRIHEAKKLKKLGMGAILAVGQGSSHPPCLIEMRYEPKSAPSRHFSLVGKGITFDSGGLSLKPSAAMETMKRDMAGGATVIAATAAWSGLGLPFRLRTYVPAAENMPDGNAIRPGDVVTAFGGKTIEILNTDAEGRLVLADALSYACNQEPDAILNLATLTGAVRIALGKRYAAIMGTDQELIDDCLNAASLGGEGLWQLPLTTDYRPDINSTVADIKNTGDGSAGTIIGGLFLREFVGTTPWAHIDFSSTAMSDGYACYPTGASGYGVRTVLTLLTNRHRKAQPSDPQ